MSARSEHQILNDLHDLAAPFGGAYRERLDDVTKRVEWLLLENEALRKQAQFKAGLYSGIHRGNVLPPQVSEEV